MQEYHIDDTPTELLGRGVVDFHSVRVKSFS